MSACDSSNLQGYLSTHIALIYIRATTFYKEAAGITVFNITSHGTNPVHRIEAAKHLHKIFFCTHQNNCFVKYCTDISLKKYILT